MLCLLARAPSQAPHVQGLQLQGPTSVRAEASIGRRRRGGVAMLQGRGSRRPQARAPRIRTHATALQPPGCSRRRHAGRHAVPTAASVGHARERAGVRTR